MGGEKIHIFPFTMIIRHC